MTPLLEVSNLRVEFAQSQGWIPAVEDLNLRIPSSSTLALVGESGSGKTVTALSIMGLLAANQARIGGKVVFAGRDLLKLTDRDLQKIRGKQMAMIFQEPMTSLNPVYSVGYQIVEVLTLHQGLSKREAWEKTYQLLDRVGIENPRQRGHSYPHQLSGGQRQRVMIAMAIACSPQLLIADEPTTALDVTIQKQILSLLMRIQDEEKMSLLFVSHDLGLVSEIADQVAVMHEGRVVESGDKTKIFKDPQHPYTRALLACRPPLAFRSKRLATLGDFLPEVPAVEEQIPPWRQKREPLKPIPADQAPLIEVLGLTKRFVTKRSFWGRPTEVVEAVKNVSLQIHRGQTLGLVGESGSGKTTLGRALLRLVEPDSGTVLFRGEDITALGAKELRRRRRSMQIIFQDPYASLNPRMKIGDAIMEPMQVHHPEYSHQQRMDRVVDLFEKVGLNPDWRGRYPYQLSGGQRQRACIARALAVEPEFLVCDESVSALDVSVQAQVLNLLSDLQSQLGLTYLFISHDLAVVRFLADELAIMKSGEIVEAGSAEAIYQSPQHSYTQQLLQSVPRLNI